MPTLRKSLIAATVALLVGATTVATQSNVSAAPAAPPPTYGIQHLNTQVDLPPGTWTDTPLEVVLPRAGTYELDANVRGRLSGVPPLNTYITARLWDVNSGTAVPQSERLVHQIIDYNAGNAEAGGNETAPISEQIRVNGPAIIRLQGLRTDALGAATIAQIYSDNSGYTSLRYERVGP
ncbi:hypothetical protein P3T36_007810 [Kitasatospora sp. MAP12-15]|uniref:hypothetical protein n=1 Tax=unclassified Kitasatospora TaxID=2633591 RepID=UPI00247609EA|nr:hypothetical protein [Kitasatospora sp. MAP12-44]MDH6108015.1 hypothetical protein [Kitasatospora sp. MAP12-44]